MNQRELINRILSRLGHPQVRVEVSESDVLSFIEEAVEKILPYITDTEFIQRPAARSINLRREGVVEVVRVFSSSLDSGTILDYDLIGLPMNYHTNLSSSSIINNISGQAERTYLDGMVERGFKYVDGTLYLDYYSGNLVIECLKKLKYEEVEDERARSWIQRYASALAKEKVGRIRSKVRIPNLPIEIDGDALISEGVSELESCRAELSAENYGFFFVTR